MFKHAALTLTQGRITYVEPSAGHGDGYFVCARGLIGTVDDNDSNTVTWYKVDNGRFVAVEVDKMDALMQALETAALKINA